MAKINVVFDTVEKTCVADLNGEQLDFSCIRFEKYDDQVYMYMSRMSEDKDNKMITYTQVTAEDGSCTFVEDKKEKLDKAIRDFLGIARKN